MPNILCPKNKKNFSENFLLSFGLQKGKEKQSLYLQSFDFNDKTLLILFKAKFAYGQKKKNREHLPLEKKTALFCFAFSGSCFFFQLSKMKKAKNKQTRSEVFFSFCQDNNTVVQDNETFFLFHNCPKSTSLWQLPLVEKKSSFFFLFKKLRSYKKSVIRDL